MSNEVSGQTPAPSAPPPKPASKKERKHDAVLKALIAAKDKDKEDDHGPPMQLMTAGGAQLLVAWLLASGKPVPPAKELIAYARQLRGQHPLVWKPLQGMNFIGFGQALAMCGLAEFRGGEMHPTWQDLQTACGELA